MNVLPYLFAGLSLFGAMLAGIAICSHRSLILRVGAIALSGLLMASSYASLVESLSRPKPLGFEIGLRSAEKAAVLDAVLVEDRAIYLWLRFDGLIEPRYYEITWNDEAAEQLQNALKEARESHSGVEMRLPFEPSLDDRPEPRFYPIPQPALPPKDVVPPAGRSPASSAEASEAGSAGGGPGVRAPTRGRSETRT